MNLHKCCLSRTFILASQPGVRRQRESSAQIALCLILEVKLGSFPALMFGQS
jgi:hypothetical protein